MADIIFNIPRDKAELLDSFNGNYNVRNVVAPEDIVEKLNEARTSLKEDGVDFIIDNFDTYFSVLHNVAALKTDIVFRAYKDLQRAVSQLDNAIIFLLEDKDNLDGEVRTKMVTILKMLLYLFTQLMLHLEEKTRKNQESLTGRKKSQSDDFVVDKEAVLGLVSKIVQREINLFWEPPVVEHDFVEVVAEMCHQFLKNPAIKQKKMEKAGVFDIFGHLIKSYGYGKTFVTRLVQSIRVYEHVVHCVPEGIKAVVEQFKCPGLVHELVMEATDWQVEETMPDNQGSKYCSLFLTELAMAMPALMIPEVLHLDQFLAHESVPLRISVLNVITEVIAKVLTRHDLSDEDKERRDEFIGVLLERVQDVSSLVRAKVFHNFARLQKDNAIPLIRQNEVLIKVVVHLFDKATNARKAAISCTTTFLEHNPYGANLKLKKIEEELARQSQLLQEVQPAKIKIMEAEWEKISNDVKCAIIEYNEKEKDEEEDGEENEEEQTSRFGKDQTAKRVGTYLKEKQYVKAYKECLKLKPHIEEWANIRKLNQTNELDLIVSILGKLFIDFTEFTADLQNGAGITADDAAKIEAIENNVRYLERTTKFLEIINRAIEGNKTLLRSTVIGDMHEAIKFFVTAYQFQIENASHGVIEMLKLMQCSEPERRAAVVEAFKTIYLTTDSKNMAEHTTTILNRLISLLREITYDNLDDLENIVSEWTSKGVLDNSVIDRCWQYYTQREPVSNEDSRCAAELLRMAAMGRSTIITKNINVVKAVAFSEKYKGDMLLLASSCRLLAVVGAEKIDIQGKEPPFKIAPTDPMFENLANVLVENFDNLEVSYYLEAVRGSCDLIFRVCSKPAEVSERIVKQIHQKMKDNKGQKVILNVRFCHLLGIVAICVLSFLDNTIYREMKRRNNVREDRKENNKNKNNRKSKSKRNNALNDSITNESVLMGAEAEDTDAEYVLNVLENYIVTNCGLLSKYVVYLKTICQKPEIYRDPTLQQVAVTALIRFMLVSSKFCAENTRLLFTILEKSTYPEVQWTILLHCSDLLTRFPNIVEPWSARIYEKLKDSNLQVRKTAFFSLSNLILKDMIRAHAHISEMAACLIDNEEDVRTMTKTFFNRFAQKEHNLANVIPDIFAHLVKADDIDEEQLRLIIKFLFELVDNASRSESLVDRFCCKFTPDENAKLNRNITYCLSLIQYNDKALKKLHEKFPSYRHHVHDPEIYAIFKQIIAETSKAKPGKVDLKPIATDIENCIASVFELNEDGQAVKPPPLAKKPVKPRAKKNQKTRGKKKIDSDSDSEDHNASRKKTCRGRKNRNSSDSD